jgi:hypothetical protein
MIDPKRITSDGVLQMGHKGPAIEVPFDPLDTWGAQAHPSSSGPEGYPVEVLLNGIRFRSAIVNRMSRHFVLVDEAMARRAEARVGEAVRLTVWPSAPVKAPPSSSPRPVAPPPPPPPAPAAAKKAAARKRR